MYKVNIVLQCVTVFNLTGKTRSRKTNGFRGSSSQLTVPGGDDQVLTEVTQTHTHADTDDHTSETAYYSDSAGKDSSIL